MTDHLAEARRHLDIAEPKLIPGQRIDVVQTHLIRAQMHVLRAQLDAFDPQPDHRAEVDKVNAVLHEHGYDYPRGAAGVDSALSSLGAHFDAMRDRVKAALALCDETITRYGDLPEAKLAARFRTLLTEDAT